MSNAVDFISAYNIIDARLRATYNGKGNLQFSDLVRRCADFNPIVAKYEEELLSYARLRNAIVHNSVRERIIAEPCDEATAEMRHIAQLLSDPPRLNKLKEKRLVGIASESSLKDAVSLMSEKGVSNLPVYQGERFAGLINNRRIVRLMGAVIKNGESVDEYLNGTSCESALREEDMIRYYKILNENSAVQEAIDAFAENKKLLAVIVTDARGEKICNMLTVADLPSLMKIVDD